jgi:hypothetical protein
MTPEEIKKMQKSEKEGKLERTTSPHSTRSNEINRENLRLFIHGNMAKFDRGPGNYFNSAYIRDDGGHGTPLLTASIQAGLPEAASPSDA